MSFSTFGKAYNFRYSTLSKGYEARSIRLQSEIYNRARKARKQQKLLKGGISNICKDIKNILDNDTEEITQGGQHAATIQMSEENKLSIATAITPNQSNVHLDINVSPIEFNTNLQHLGDHSLNSSISSLVDPENIIQAVSGAHYRRRCITPTRLQHQHTSTPIHTAPRQRSQSVAARFCFNSPNSFYIPPKDASSQTELKSSSTGSQTTIKKKKNCPTQTTQSYLRNPLVENTAQTEVNEISDSSTQTHHIYRHHKGIQVYPVQNSVETQINEIGKIGSDNWSLKNKTIMSEAEINAKFAYYNDRIGHDCIHFVQSLVLIIYLEALLKVDHKELSRGQTKV